MLIRDAAIDPRPCREMPKDNNDPIALLMIAAGARRRVFHDRAVLGLAVHFPRTPDFEGAGVVVYCVSREQMKCCRHGGFWMESVTQRIRCTRGAVQKARTKRCPAT